MPRITKVVTHVGDKGYTYLVKGEKVSKSSRRVRAYGDIDELNSCIGIARSVIGESKDYKEIDNILKVLQGHLFLLGAELAHSNPPDNYPKIENWHLKYVENLCESLNKELPPLKEFILPYGCYLAVVLHFIRTVSRRAERSIVHLHEKEHLRNIIIKYINRVSDLFFILARFANKVANIKEEVINFRELYENGPSSKK